MKFFLIGFLCFGFVLNTFAQEPCGFDHIHQKLLKYDPAYARRMEENERLIQEYIQRAEKFKVPARQNAVLYTIPVVVHVVHTGGSVGTIYNPTDEQIMGAIDYLNQVFNGTYPGIEGAGDIQIQFVMAKRDPNCNPTNGIVRVDGSSISGYVAGGVRVSTTTGVLESSVKNFTRWDATKYYNIWIVNRLDGVDGTGGQFTAGYAYFPGSPLSVDGTVMLATQMRSGNKVLTHEIGHALNLFHPFQGSSNSTTCPTNTNCNTDGDRVCDTDPITYNQTGGVVNFTCRTGPNTCTGGTFSKNTENNFMGYTNCFTLFTNGQKARMQAAMSLSSRSSLANSTASLPTNVDPVCSPKVNFGTTTSTFSEATEAKSGCRAYKDYTVPVTIASAPSADANVVITLTGTALQGVDYDLFTNGNFTTPSNTLTFPSGSDVVQPLTIRVYDDKDLESVETITLNYTVSGGGALKGEARPVHTVSITDNDGVPVVPVPLTDYSIATNNNIATNQSPFRSDRQKHRLQVLFRAAELTAVGITSGTLSALTINVSTKNSTKPFKGFTISIGQTSSTTLTAFTGSTLTQVYQGDYSTIVGENRINFNTVYNWDGVSNLVVQFCFDNGSDTPDALADQVRATTSPFGTGNRASCLSNYSSGATAGCSLAAAGVSDARLFVKITRGLKGNPVASGLNSVSEYLGPNADVVYYTADGEVIARIKNQTAFDYGCTTLEIDRVGTGTASFWNPGLSNQLTQKTFKVTPQFPNPSGSYDITLYYTDLERRGFETATGRLWSAVQMIKTPSNVSAVTSENPQVDAVTINSSLTHGTFGQDLTVRGSFTNGFSGFALGNPGTFTSSPIVENGVIPFSVYPNPVRSSLAVQFGKTLKNVQFRILMMDGRVLKTDYAAIVFGTHLLDMGRFKKGSYLLEVITPDMKRTIPILKD
ncbi:MAG: zinc-dependent metalloprotease [Lacibacter sp.]